MVSIKKIHKTFTYFLFFKRICEFYLRQKNLLNFEFSSRIKNSIEIRKISANKIINLLMKNLHNIKQREKDFSIFKKLSIKIISTELKNIYCFYASFIKNNNSMNRVKEYFTIRFSEMKLQDNHFPINKKSKSVFDKQFESPKNSNEEKKAVHKEKKLKNLELLKTATDKIEEEIIAFNSILDKCSLELDELLQQISENGEKMKLNTSNIKQ